MDVQTLYFPLVLILLSAIAGIVFYRKRRDASRQASAINAVLAKLALMKMDPIERQDCYQAAARMTRHLSADDVQTMSERERLPLLASSMALANRPPAIEGETWRRGFASITEAESEIAEARDYFRKRHGIEVFL